MINVAVEGESDREIARAVAGAAGHRVNLVRVAGGKTKLDPLIPKYNQASIQMPWVVFRDSDARCPVELRAQLALAIPNWRPDFRLRIAHSMSEAWLLADRERFSDFFSVPLGRVPNDPESLNHAKRTVLSLCESSHSRVIKRDMVAVDGGTGALYVSRINEFAASAWRPKIAAVQSDSLDRAIARIRELPGPEETV